MWSLARFKQSGSPNEFFVSISEPVSLRRTILESSRSIIHVLQEFEVLRNIRKEKIDLIHKLDSVMKELFSLSSKLKSELPKMPKKKASKPVKKESVKRKHSRSKKIVPKTRSALEQLQSELDDVEKQLSQLSWA